MDADTNAEDVLYKHKDDEMSDQQEEDHDSQILANLNILKENKLDET